MGVIVLHRELGYDRGDALGPGGVTSMGGTTDHGDDGKKRGRWRVVVTLGSGFNGRRLDPPQSGCISGGGRQP